MEHFGDTKLSELGSNKLYDFEKWRRTHRFRGKKISPTTIIRDLAFLSSVISEAETWEWCTHNPVKAYLRGRKKKILVEGEARERYASHEEETAMLAHVDVALEDPAVADMMWDAIAFAIDTGLRAEEQWALKPENFNWARRRVKVFAADAKSNKSRWVPLTDRAYEIANRRRFSNRSEYIFWRYDGERIEHT